MQRASGTESIVSLLQPRSGDGNSCGFPSAVCTALSPRSGVSTFCWRAKGRIQFSLGRQALAVYPRACFSNSSIPSFMSYSSSGYSARVEMQLLLPGGESLPVAQSGPDFLILKQPAVRPPSPAELVVDVDGSVSRYPCFLMNGISGARVAVECQPRAPVPFTRVA